MSALPPPAAFRDRLAAVLADVPADALEVPEDGRVAAVLVLFADDPQDGLQLVLTRRRRDLRSHPGQLSFPGGRVDDDDGADPVVAALREAEEEMALRAPSVSVLGTGRVFYLPPSRFWVAPVVAWWDEPHHLVANPDEVDEVLRVPVAQLLDPARWRGVPLSAGGSTWAWQLDEDLLWGATAIVTALLLAETLGDWSAGVRPEDLAEELQVRPWETAPAWTPRTRLERVPSRAVADVPSVDRDGVVRVLTALGRAALPAVTEAAAGATERVIAELLGDVDDHDVTVLVGPAGTGAIGLELARRLLARGVDVTVRLAASRDDVDLPDHVVVPPPPPEAGVRLDRRMGVHVHELPEVDRPAGDLIVDALLGPGAEPPLHGGPALLAAWAARHDLPVVSVALPSGVAADTGLIGPSLHADVTLALGLPTAGLLEPIVAPYAGEVVVADVGIPQAVYAAAGITVPSDLFREGPLLRLDRGQVNTDAGTPDQGPGD